MNSLIDVLAPHAKRFGAQLAREAFERGLAVTSADGTRVPIPITATPVVVPAQEIRRRAQLSALLASAGLKMATAVLNGPTRELLLASLAPLERGVVLDSFRHLSRLAITRVDYFITGSARALELNATIPAMPAYSDIAAETFIEVVGRDAGLSEADISTLVARNGSNVRALYEALLQSHQDARGRAPRRIAILVRRGDPQISEIRHLRARFESLGTETELVHPDELPMSGEPTVHGKPVDLVYRHLFVNRLEEISSPYLIDYFSHPEQKHALLVNGPAAHVETKTTFALLSQAMHEPALRLAAKLTDAELDAIKASVPWTRPLRAHPGTDPDGQHVPNLAERVAREPSRFVLKRAWGYGGKAVFLGSAVGHPAFDERVVAAYGSVLSWRELVARASQDTAGGGFVAQEAVELPLEQHLLCTPDAIHTVSLYVDYSAYASVGLSKQPLWGAACRGSLSQIVNIAGGGGVLPLLTTEVFEIIEKALRSR